MMLSLENIWNENQILLPPEFRKFFNPKIGYNLHEWELKQLLVNNGYFDIWEKWKKEIRPIVYKNRVIRYSSDNYYQQIKIEQNRRSIDWYGLLNKILCELKVPQHTGNIIDVGSYDGREVSGLKYNVTCIDPEIDAINRGKAANEKIKYLVGTCDSIPVESNQYDAYLSLRTWCIAGVLPDEALLEAIRILKPYGGIIISFPLFYSWNEEKKDFGSKYRNKIIENILEKTIAILESKLDEIYYYSAPEDYFIYGKLK